MSREAETPLLPDRFEELLRAESPVFNLSLPPSTFARLARYLSELDRWRRHTNLTGQLSPGELAVHALESVVGESLIAHGERVVDIGSGAGFPGLALAIARPDLSISLVEPRQRRAAFLRHIARELELPPVEVVEDRIEKVGGQTFGVATTRAVGSFGSWIGDAGFISSGGALLAWTTQPSGARRRAEGAVHAGTSSGDSRLGEAGDRRLPQGDPGMFHVEHGPASRFPSLS